MKIKLYPKSYDPLIASGPPTKDILKMGIFWTQEQTTKQVQLEIQATILEVSNPPDFQWYEKL